MGSVCEKVQWERGQEGIGKGTGCLLLKSGCLDRARKPAPRLFLWAFLRNHPEMSNRDSRMLRRSTFHPERLTD